MKTSTKILIGVGVVAVIGGIAFLLYKRNKPKVEINKTEKEPTVTESSNQKKSEAPVKASTTLSQEEANKIAKEIKSTADSEKKQKLTMGYISPNLARFQNLKQAGYNYSNGIATKN